MTTIDLTKEWLRFANSDIITKSAIVNAQKIHEFCISYIG